MGYALFWGVLYGLLDTVAQWIGGAAPPFMMLAYACLLVIWLGKQGWLARFYLCLPTVRDPRVCLHLLPLLFFMTVNLAERGGGPPLSLALVLMAGTVMTEEIVFRGVLLRVLEKLPPLMGVLLSATIFALFHLVNAMGQTDGLFILYSLLYAFAAGVLYAAVTLHFNSLIPAAVGHYLANVTAPDGGEHPSVLFLLCMAVCALWGILLGRKGGQSMKGE